MSPLPDRMSGLRRIRRARRKLFFILLLFITYGIGTMILSEHFGISFFYFFGLFVAVFGSFGLYVALLRCPKCGAHYFWRLEGFGYRNIFSNRCLNCKLSMHADTDKG
jgi:hypothetical protein